MKIIEISQVASEQGSPADLRRLFSNEVPDQSCFTLGVATFPPGARIPPKGVAAHTGDEYSIAIRGRILSGTKTEESYFSAGQACFIPAGEEHYAYNDSDADCEIVWGLFAPKE